MGKRIIIKGADFLENAISKNEIDAWYTNQKTKYVERTIKTGTSMTKFNQPSKYWAFNDDQQEAMRGKRINIIRLIPYNITTLNLYKVSSLTSDLPSTPVATATFTSGDKFIEVKLDKDIILGSDEYLVFNNGAYIATQQKYEDQKFYRRVCFSDANLYSEGDALILMDFGYKNY